MHFCGSFFKCFPGNELQSWMIQFFLSKRKKIMKKENFIILFYKKMYILSLFLYRCLLL